MEGEFRIWEFGCRIFEPQIFADRHRSELDESENSLPLEEIHFGKRNVLR